MSGLRMRSSERRPSCACFWPSKRSSAWLGGRRSVTEAGSHCWVRLAGGQDRGNGSAVHKHGGSHATRWGRMVGGACLVCIRRPDLRALFDLAYRDEPRHGRLRSPSTCARLASTWASTGRWPDQPRAPSSPILGRSGTPVEPRSCDLLPADCSTARTSGRRVQGGAVRGLGAVK